MERPVRKRAPLHTKILGGLVLGALCGGAFHILASAETVEWVTRNLTEPVGQLFLRLLLMLVVPLVFSSLVLGVYGVGDLRRFGRIGLRSLAYTVVITAISVLIGLTLANTVKPGKRIPPEVSAQLRTQYGHEAQRSIEQTTSDVAKDAPFLTMVKTIVPVNVFGGIAKNPPDMLGLMFAAIFFGVALTLIGEKARPVVAVMEGLYEAIAKCVALVMHVAPYAVFALLFTLTARFGVSTLSILGWYMGTVLFGLAFQMFVVYSISVYVLSGIPPVEFFRRIRTVIITAFSTSSSNVTLPTSLVVSEKNLGVPREINSFVLTVGATANQNGTALFEGFTVLFLAQLSGIDLTVGQQVMVLYLAILGGIGTAGIPSGSTAFVVGMLATVGVDPTLIAVILGVDRLLDMCRTVLNVTGDITIATYVARAEGAVLLPTLEEADTEAL